MVSTRSAGRAKAPEAPRPRRSASPKPKRVAAVHKKAQSVIKKSAPSRLAHMRRNYPMSAERVFGVCASIISSNLIELSGCIASEMVKEEIRKRSTEELGRKGVESFVNLFSNKNPASQVERRLEQLKESSVDQFCNTAGADCKEGSLTYQAVQRAAQNGQIESLCQTGEACPPNFACRIIPALQGCLAVQRTASLGQAAYNIVTQTQNAVSSGLLAEATGAAVTCVAASPFLTGTLAVGAGAATYWTYQVAKSAFEKID